MNARQKIIRVLRDSTYPVANNEIVIPGIRQGTINRKLYEFEKAGIIVRVKVEGIRRPMWVINSDKDGVAIEDARAARKIYTNRWLKTAPEKRFWARVIKTSGCWTRTGSNNGVGYSLLNVNGERVYAHRYSWELTNGPIPPGLVVMHKCDNPPCVRPDHLAVGTHVDNMRDCSEKGRNKRNYSPEKYRRIGAIRWANRRAKFGPTGSPAKTTLPLVVAQ